MRFIIISILRTQPLNNYKVTCGLKLLKFQLKGKKKEYDTDFYYFYTNIFLYSDNCFEKGLCYGIFTNW
ncbi:MAG TPA: hypothetical protein DHW42_07380 [Candidatus Marinimicrobia bacterium]|nr:hypothetical protein [Candidatus Neomarinimicrobiota bacterium]